MGGGRLWESQQGLSFLQVGFALRAPQAIGADFDKALGKHVTEEAVDKLLGLEANPLQLLGAIASVTEGNLPVLERFQAVMAIRKT